MHRAAGSPIRWDDARAPERELPRVTSSYRSGGLPLLTPSNEVGQGGATNIGDLAELDEIEAALAGFVVADQRLGSTEPLGYLCLAT